ncbi:hypothetical protein [[Actinomadura] parvosata]|uniref:hypothetical protein n=1 Tax=[Actinomadura] parvosata TaxID=1955412 RepID=UPI0012BBA549|nr:hypothetical protein [Nonomuraea sp. ATCC 55076]
MLHPERIIEYPSLEELPEQLQQPLSEWDDEADFAYSDLLSVATGCKIGGWVSWGLTDMYKLACEVCGAETELLLKFASSEWEDDGEQRWRPLEERRILRGTPEYAQIHEPTTLQLGRDASLYIFVCPQSADHGYRLSIQ